MTVLRLSDAQTLINTALTTAKRLRSRPMAVVVVDASAQVVASARDDGASALRLDIALGKAAATVGMGVNSRELAQRAKEMPAFFHAIASSSSQKFVPQTGAILLLDSGGSVLGAAGASGGTGDEDEQCVIAGALEAGLSLFERPQP
ncbi:MAG TPA: heme-binding protein [Polyangiales bacterium]|nr:heme-binding protein [Polyangiales bacterium]